MGKTMNPTMRYSKLLRDVRAGAVFLGGTGLRRPIDAERLIGRHEGRAPKSAGGGPRPSLSSLLAARTGPARWLRSSRAGKGGSFDPRQRAIVKVHYFSHGGGGAAALRAHARYVARDAADRDLDAPPIKEDPQIARDAGERVEAHVRSLERDRGRFFDAAEDRIDATRRVADWAHQDRRHFRLILAAENGARLRDLRSFTREVMDRAERALGTRLEWVAINHWDTDNPHTHIVLRGRTEDGRDLMIPREFVSHGLRNAARDIATTRLGHRGRGDERLALERETRAHRPTRLDPLIEQQLDGKRQIRLARLEAPTPDVANALKARAQELKRLGLAQEIARNIFEFKLGWRDDLRRLELHLDIRKSLMRVRAQDMKPLQQSQKMVRSRALGPDR
jgi:type IV secretory pathway VirD2 relaxase